MVNLNNGGVSPTVEMALDAVKRHLDTGNAAPSYFMWRHLEPQQEGVRAQLAREWKVDPEEVAITRNATESLHICQLGIDLQAGDVLLANPPGLSAHAQRVPPAGGTGGPAPRVRPDSRPGR